MRVLPGKAEWLVFAASLWAVVTCNAGFWRVLAAGAEGGNMPAPGHLFSFLLLAVGLTALAVQLLAVGPLFRLLLVSVLPLAAAAGYCTMAYGVLFDQGMVTNVAETNVAEATELLSPTFIAFVLVFGIAPAIVVLRTALPRRRLLLATGQRLAGLALAAALIAGPLLADQRAVFSISRNHRELAHMLAPLDVMVASAAYAEDRFRTPPPFVHVGEDAARVSRVTGTVKPAVHVIVLGETARAGSFSLNGYERQTNPALAALDVMSFTDVSSCGTATAQSVPCMFSVETMAGFDRTRSRYQDNLLDIAARAGYDVYWVENGNSCKGVCQRITNIDLASVTPDGECEVGHCRDGALVDELERLLDGIERDTLIVLHQLGSHGPAYYRRYPDEFRRFLPDCRSEDLAACSDEEIRNAYDNTILYTDHVVAGAIAALRESAGRYSTSLVYVSDHGESTGEHNVYLHGMPRRIAPEEQVHVPMIAWFGPSTPEARELAPGCREDAVRQPLSHDNLFHTELAILGIDTAVYDPGLDALAACRQPAALLARHGGPGPMAAASRAGGDRVGDRR